MLKRIFTTIWIAVFEIIRGIDTKLKYEKTPKERIMWWTIIILILVAVFGYIFLELGAFINKLYYTSGMIKGDSE